MFNSYFFYCDGVSDPYYMLMSEIYCELNCGEYEGPNESAAWDMYRYLRGEGM